jgi:hypothetical protein
MDISDIRIGDRVEVESPHDGPYTGTVEAVMADVKDGQPGVHLKDCVDNPSGLTWAYAHEVTRKV